jgi:hypothetical protein
MYTAYHDKGVVPPGTVLDCGHGTVGPAAWTADERVICYVCSDAEEVAALAAADHYTGYLSGDGEYITTWPGGTLARVTELRHSSRGGASGAAEMRFRAVSADGASWYGTSPAMGMFARMRRAKRAG